MQSWQLQEAKNKLSQVVDEALAEGPQIITRRGQQVAVVISFEAYERLTGGDENLYEFFRKSPLVGVDLDLSRDDSPIPDRFVP